MIKNIFLGFFLQIFTICLAISFVASSFWIQIYYQLPFFKTDIINQSKEERLQLAENTLIILNSKVNNWNNLFLQIGYNQREINHLYDVKTLFQIKDTFWIISLMCLILILRFYKTKKELLRDIKKVIKTSFLSLIVLTIVAVIFWEKSFELFHQILFEPGTWMFYESDLLIRLFPPQFWFASFIAVCTTVFILEGVIYFICQKYHSKITSS